MAEGDRSATEPVAVVPNLQAFTEIGVRLGALLLLGLWCLQIVGPFLGIVVWAFIIAIASTRPYERATAMLGGRRRLAAAAFVLVGLLALIVPAVILSETLVGGARHFAHQVEGGAPLIPPPPPLVADLPLIGTHLHPVWLKASENLEAALRELGPQLQAVSRWLLSAASSAGVALLQFLASIVIAAVMLAHGENRKELSTRFASRVAGERGPEFLDLAESTIGSVVQGILGVAVIQAVLAGLGFVVAGVTGAGLWALLVLVAAVVQLPVALVMIPPVLIVFSSASTPVAVAFLIWCGFVSLVDNVLKPILFGRGARVLTLVIFLGAIGGMLSMGIIGLFLGAVVLALGYEVLRAWLLAERPHAGSG